MHTYTFTHMHTFKNTFMHIYTFTHMHTFKNTFMHTYTFTYMHTCTHACKSTHMHVCIYVCHVCAGVSGNKKRVLDPLELELTGSFQLPTMGADRLEELSAEPPLQPLV